MTLEKVGCAELGPTTVGESVLPFSLFGSVDDSILKSGSLDLGRRCCNYLCRCEVRVNLGESG